MTNNFASSPFDAIRRFDQNGDEYWSARELCKLLGYSTWQRFQGVIEQAKIACENSGQATSDHFNIDVKIVKAGATKKPKEDYRLSRYACYLIALNADSSKEIVAQAQTYFAVQTRRQELADERVGLPATEEERRLRLRGQIREKDTQLKAEVKKAGAKTSHDYAKFFDRGYQGLYGGERENDIHARKQLQSNQKILDYMGGDELSYNDFRATLAKQRLEREQPKQKEQANNTHYEVGSAVRATIKGQGGILPEDLPTPEKSIQQLEQERDKEIQMFLHRQQQPLLPVFDEPDETYGEAR